MFYSCTHTATVGVQGLIIPGWFLLTGSLSLPAGDVAERREL